MVDKEPTPAAPDSKRKGDESNMALAVKKQKTDQDKQIIQQVPSFFVFPFCLPLKHVPNFYESRCCLQLRVTNCCFPQGPPRTSSLQAPIMLLTGHQAAVYTLKFNPSGSTLASGSFDKDICSYCCRHAPLPQLSSPSSCSLFLSS